MRIVVNTISTKKAAGGAYQIAYNFLMQTLKYDDVEWFYLTSSEVDESVGKYFEQQKGKNYFVYPTQPDFKGTYRQVKNELVKWEEQYNPDVIYTISSPCYFTFKTKEVMRFANAWITNPNKYAWKALPLRDWLRMRLYRINQNRMLRGAKYIITQSETVGEGLVRLLGLPKKSVKVVPNVLPKVFTEFVPERVLDKGFVDIACIAAPFPHKNLIILPKVLKALKENHRITNVRFHLTIQEDNSYLRRILDECEEIGLEANIINHGRCSQEKLAEIYNHCSICFLPSLLETFSASSLEAMYFGLSIVATDFKFNREILDEACLYYQPTDAEDAANKIATLINNPQFIQDLNYRMAQRLPLYNNYRKHFDDIKDFLVKVGNGEV